jgi:predicted nucleic acid-binding protein
VIFEEEPFIEASRKLLKQIEARKFEAYLSSITLAEIIWVVHRESGYRKAKEVQSYLKELCELGQIRLVPLRDGSVYRMLRLVQKYNLSFVDALVVSAATNLNGVLITRDDKIKGVKEIEVKTPDELIPEM